MKQNYFLKTKDKSYKLKNQILLEEAERLTIKGMEHQFSQQNSNAMIQIR